MTMTTTMMTMMTMTVMTLDWEHQPIEAGDHVRHLQFFLSILEQRDESSGENYHYITLPCNFGVMKILIVPIVIHEKDRVIFLTASPPHVQYQNKTRLISQAEALLDEGFHGREALVG